MKKFGRAKIKFEANRCVKIGNLDDVCYAHFLATNNIKIS